MPRLFNLRHYIRKMAAYDETDGYYEPRFDGMQTVATQKWMAVQQSAVVACSEFAGLLIGKGWMNEDGTLTEAGKKALYE